MKILVLILCVIVSGTATLEVFQPEKEVAGDNRHALEEYTKSDTSHEAPASPADTPGMDQNTDLHERFVKIEFHRSGSQKGLKIKTGLYFPKLLMDFKKDEEHRVDSREHQGRNQHGRDKHGHQKARHPGGDDALAHNGGRDEHDPINAHRGHRPRHVPEPEDSEGEEMTNGDRGRHSNKNAQRGHHLTSRKEEEEDEEEEDDDEDEELKSADSDEGPPTEGKGEHRNNNAQRRHHPPSRKGKE